MKPEQKQRIVEIEARQPERAEWQYGKDIEFLLSLVESQEAGRQSRISDLDEHGFRTADYSEDEQAVCDYLRSRTTDVGCGNDPIGFLIASHSWAVHERDEAATSMRSACIEKVRETRRVHQSSGNDDYECGYDDAMESTITALESVSIQEQEK